MALARLSVGVGKKGKASSHALYIAREEKYAKDNNDLEKLEAKGHGNMPRWAEKEPNYFWKMSDEHERKNGTSYREHVIALPRELTIEQRHELVKHWIEQEIGDKHAYQYAIHNPPALDGKEQPHVHLMFSERLRDGIERDPKQYFMRYNSKNPDKGGAKKANTPKLLADRKAELKQQRDRWEQTCNKHLEQANSAARINMKSYKDQNISYKPLNIPMHQFNKPAIKAAYKATLDAKADWIQIARERKEIDIAAELERLTQPTAAAARAMNIANVLFSSSKQQPKSQPPQSDLLQKDEAGRFATHADIEKAVEIYHRATESPDTTDSVFDATVASKFTERQLELLDDTAGMGTDIKWITRKALQRHENNELVALLLDPEAEQAKYDKEHDVGQAQAAQKQSKDITAHNATAAAETKPSTSIMRRRP
uniref:MobA/MobL family protein n=1 Tax=Psychrobacter sp. TaxID=56811 RepID=UPI00159A7C32|nr:MobA/MobL family protein [Psychrobacter sp.]QJS05706.1 mmobilization protein MobA [Psychrobacter sp.]